MAVFVFRSVSGNLPNGDLAFKVAQLGPLHTRDLSSALASQKQNAKEGAEDAALSLEGAHETPEFLFGQHTIAPHLRMRCPNAVCWRRGDDVALSAPIKEFAQIEEGALRSTGRTAGIDGVNDIYDIALANPRHRTVLPNPCVAPFEDTPV